MTKNISSLSQIKVHLEQLKTSLRADQDRFKRDLSEAAHKHLRSHNLKPLPNVQDRLDHSFNTVVHTL